MAFRPSSRWSFALFLPSIQRAEAAVAERDLSLWSQKGAFIRSFVRTSAPRSIVEIAVAHANEILHVADMQTSRYHVCLI